MNKHVLGYIFALLTILIWGSTFVVTKVLLEHLEPSQILITRFLITVIFLVVVYPKYNTTFSIKNDKYFVLAGVAIASYFIFENNGIKNTYASNVSLIIATIPLLTNLLYSFVNKQNFFTKKTTVGFTMSYIGVILIVISGNKLEGISPIGDIFALIAAASFAIYTLFLDRIDENFHVIQKTRRIFFYALLFITINALLMKQPIIPIIDSPVIIVELLFLSIIASSMAFIMWNKAVEYNGSVKTNVFTYLNPVVTMVFSVIILHENITIVKVIGGVIIIMGIYLSENEQKLEK